MRLICADDWDSFYADMGDSRNMMDSYDRGYTDAIDHVDDWMDAQPTIDAVVIPCKIGDFVWAIRNYNGVPHPQQGKVIDMYFTADMRLHIVVSHIARGEWGKTVFPTYEEASEAIKERCEFRFCGERR